MSISFDGTDGRSPLLRLFYEFRLIWRSGEGQRATRPDLQGVGDLGIRDSTASEMTAQILQPVLRLVEAVAVDEKASIYMVGARIKSVSITLMS